MTIDEVAAYVKVRLDYNRIQYRSYPVTMGIVFSSAGYTLLVTDQNDADHNLVINVGPGPYREDPPTYTAENADPCIGAFFNYVNARMRQLQVLDGIAKAGKWEHSQLNMCPLNLLMSITGKEGTKSELLAVLCACPSLLEMYCSVNGIVLS